MARTIEVDTSALASVWEMAWGGPCTGSLFDPHEFPGWVPLDDTTCQHVTEAGWCVKAADLVLDRVVTLHRAGPEGSKLAASELARLIDEFCGTPPRWPFPWPPKSPLKDHGELAAVAVIAVAARLQTAAEGIELEQARSDVEGAADQMFGVGFERLAQEQAERGKG
jgi:hypothetical protein